MLPIIRNREDYFDFAKICTFRFPLDALLVCQRAVFGLSDGAVGLLCFVRGRSAVWIQRHACLRVRCFYGEV